MCVGLLKLLVTVITVISNVVIQYILTQWKGVP